ncbi:HARB1 nuclease, partial [Amia calva]|nr:HARB1 nuclease [Amia calva]
WAHPRAYHWWDTIVPEFNSEQFLQNFRVSWESFDYICRRLRHVLERNTNYRLCVSVQKCIATALWKLATNSEYRSISHLFGVGLSTVFNCVQEREEMAQFFNNRWRVPQCVGAIDGSHIPIIAPEEYARDYFNQKGWHSIVLQAAVDGKGLFWDVCVGYPESVHDARLLRQSYLWEMLCDGQLLIQNKVNLSGHEVGQYLIGDPAYLLQNWLMKQFADTGRLTPQQQTYNFRLSSVRAIVETTFGRLNRRWRCLLKRNDCNLELTKRMVMTCCVLHNICEEHGDHFGDPPVIHMNMQPPVQVLPEHGQLEGADVRAALMDYFNGEED